MFRVILKRHIGIFVLILLVLITFIKKIYNIDFLSPFNLSIKTNFVLKDVTKDIGINHQHITLRTHSGYKNVEPWLRAAGAFVSVSDINNDGYSDIFLGSSKIGTQSSLYINLKNGKFKNSTKQSGLSDLNKKYPTTGGIFFDCDNDGDKDFISLSKCPIVYKNNKGKFSKQTKGNPKCVTTVLSAYNVIDINKDGNLDLIFGEYFKSDIIDKPVGNNDVLPQNFIDSSNNSNLNVLTNNGRCQFKETSDYSNIKNGGWYWDISIYDINKDGKKAIWLSTDYGQDNFFLENSNGTFIEHRDEISKANLSKNGMSLSFAQPNNNETTFAYSSQIMKTSEKISGNLLWEISETLNFTNMAISKNVQNCGWSWGTKFLDINNDSLLDIIAVNGFISNSKTKNYWYNLSTLDSSGNNVMGNHKNWPDMKDFSLAGHQRDCLFLNNNKEYYVNVSHVIGLDSEKQDGRGVATIDIENNGQLSIVVANQNGIAKVYTPTKTENNWIGFKLRRKVGHKSLFGTWFRVFLENKDQLTHYYYPTNGFSSQSDEKIHFGLGTNKISKIEITWPSGKKERLGPKMYNINQYNQVWRN